MAKLPERIKLAKLARKPFEFVEKFFPKLNIHPNVFTALGALLSILFVFFPYSFPTNALILLAILLLDVLDGAYARQAGLKSKEGYIIDVTFDRLSEVIIGVSLIDSLVGKIFLAFTILNFILTFRSIVTGKHVIMTLRVILFVYLLVHALGWI